MPSRRPEGHGAGREPGRLDGVPRPASRTTWRGPGSGTSSRGGCEALLRLTRPPVNALDREALEAMASLVERARGDRAVRTLAIASGLPGIFCAGGDLRYCLYAGGGARSDRAGRRVFGAPETLETPTVAAIDGHVIGDGASLALSADLRVASPGSPRRLARSRQRCAAHLPASHGWKRGRRSTSRPCGAAPSGEGESTLASGASEGLAAGCQAIVPLSDAPPPPQVNHGRRPPVAHPACREA